MIVIIGFLLLISLGLYFLLWKCKQRTRILWALGFFIISYVGLNVFLNHVGDKPLPGSKMYTEEEIQQYKPDFQNKENTTESGK
jgi:uncharacterized SAM-binding protein YcdF (DUF218 family)